MKIILFLYLFFGSALAFSQTTQTEVVPGGGGSTENGTYKNFGTFGQPSASKSSNSQYTNKEGFLNAQASPGCTNPTDGGEIAADQSNCYDTAPAEIESSSLPTGHTGTLEYKWQSSTTSSSTGFTDIAGSNNTAYTPNTLTDTTWFKRLARVDCSSDWTGAAESNVVEVIVKNAFVTGAIKGASTLVNYPFSSNINYNTL